VVRTAPGHAPAVHLTDPSVRFRPSSRARVTRRVILLLLGTFAVVIPGVASAWPAVQDEVGTVYLCESRPSQLADGRWACRSAGGTYAGALLEVARPGTLPGVRPWDVPPGARYRYVPYPWGPPPREPSGYDALDPWLGKPGSSER
jgi:hypothetical protein